MTTSFERVLQQNNLLKVFRLLSLTLGLVALMLSIALWFEHHGFDKGYEIAETYHSIPSDSITFAAHGPRTYEFFAARYEYIAYLLLVFLLAKLAETAFRENLRLRRALFQLFYSVSLILVLYHLWVLFSEKNLRSQTIFWSEPYDQVIRNSVTSDWICLILAIVLLIVQALTPIFEHLANRRNPDST